MARGKIECFQQCLLVALLEQIHRRFSKSLGFQPWLFPESVDTFAVREQLRDILKTLDFTSGHWIGLLTEKFSVWWDSPLVTFEKSQETRDTH